MKSTREIQTAVLSAGYAPLLADLKARVRAAQVKAALSVNRELILLYWHIGREILRAQKAEGWGTKVVQRLAKDLAKEFPEMSGFSSRNLKRMRTFAEAYVFIGIVPQPVAQLALATPGGEIFPQAVGKLAGASVQQTVGQIVSQPVTQLDGPPEPLALLPWGSNILLIEKVKDPVARLWYARKTLEHGWSRAVLTVQIESRLHERSGKAVTNFDRTLPPAQSDLAREVLKDPYTFDFLSIGEEAQERDLERGLVQHIQQFLLELGAGFSFVGRQVRIEVGGDEYSLDLLFYHLRLRCFVVVDLKMKPFEPEFAGKIHPMRYSRYVLLRLRSQEPQGRATLHRILQRPSETRQRTRSRGRQVHSPSPACGTYLLRSMSQPRRRNPAGELPKIRMGQTISKVPATGLSHGVNFYLSAVDDQMRHPDDAPTIGLLLCKDSKNKLKVEHALRDVKKPIGVAEWQTRLVESLPRKLRGSLPTVQELERELGESNISEDEK